MLDRRRRRPTAAARAQQARGEQSLWRYGLLLMTARAGGESLMACWTARSAERSRLSSAGGMAPRGQPSHAERTRRAAIASGGIRRRWFGLTALRRSAARRRSPDSVDRGGHRLGPAPAGWRLVAVIAVACVVAAAAAPASVVRMQRRPDDCQVARFVEERPAPRTGAGRCDTLVSAVEVLEAPDRHSGVFAALLVRQAVALLRWIDADVP